VRLPSRRDDSGFTLIELLVVIVIIGLLAGIAIPVFLGQRSKATGAQGISDLRNVGTAEEVFLSDHDSYLDTSAPATDLTGFKQSNNVTSISIETLNADGTKNGANGVGGYCATALTASGQRFYYNSLTGGITNVPCP
jgi:type IV pilus assembly protein PilA